MLFMAGSHAINFSGGLGVENFLTKFANGYCGQASDEFLPRPRGTSSNRKARGRGAPSKKQQTNIKQSYRDCPN
jgi:hypothetical protein